MEVLERLDVRDRGNSAVGVYGQELYPSSQLKSIELFAGAGGLSLGVARAGFKHLAVVEYDSHACETLQVNKARTLAHIRDWPVIEKDIREVKFHHFEGEVDLLAGGPPCQPFSLGGKHRGRGDQRDMFPELVRAIRECRPKAILVENVKGLLRPSFLEYFTYILRQLENPHVVAKKHETWDAHLQRLTRSYSDADGYNLVYRCINTADYGSAQKRWRVIILGVRKDLRRIPTFPSPTCSENALLWNKWISNSYWDTHKVSRKQRPNIDPRLKKRVERISQDLFHPPTDPWRTVRDALAGLPDPEYHPKIATRFLNHVHNPGARSYPGHTGSPLDEPAKALKAGDHGVPGGENMLVRTDGSLRYFTIRECARLQDFDDEYLFPGTTTNVMRQLGNAVPSKVGQVMASSLARILQEAGDGPGSR